MSPPVDHVPSDPELPARATVVIVGGGIIGVCTAFFLARDGIPVVLCEKGEIGAEQSSRNWGWCRKMGRDAREIPLAIEALRLWNDMNKLIEAESGFRDVYKRQVERLAGAVTNDRARCQIDGRHRNCMPFRRATGEGTPTGADPENPEAAAQVTRRP